MSTPRFEAEFQKRFPRGLGVSARLEFPIDGFSVTVLFGPSGSGKTTVLRCVVGLERPDQGVIRFGDETWFDRAHDLCWPPQRRGVGYVSQDYALFPHLTVDGNIAYGVTDLKPAERVRRMDEVLEKLGLRPLRQRYPGQLSGGEQQRVALARALVRRPRLLLLDEPLSALDAPTREALRADLRLRLASAGVPVVLVTHDRTEAVTLGDRIVVMNDGHVCQSGMLEEVFSRPASPEVARIVGVETLVPGEVLSVRDGLAEVRVGTALLLAVAGTAGPGTVLVTIRGEEVVLIKGGLESSPATSARNHLPCTIRALTREGPLVRVVLDAGFPLVALITRQSCEELLLREGVALIALVKAPAVHLIPRS